MSDARYRHHCRHCGLTYFDAAKGREIIKLGMELLDVPDLSQEHI